MIFSKIKIARICLVPGEQQPAFQDLLLNICMVTQWGKSKGFLMYILIKKVVRQEVRDSPWSLAIDPEEDS